jgi:hypothetical protein
MMSFCTAVNCMDGRVQQPVIDYLIVRFSSDYVDTITEPGPVGLLANDPASIYSQSIFRRIDVSVNAHHSKGIAIVAHHDCAGNPKSEIDQIEDLSKSFSLLRSRYPRLPVVALWVDENWKIVEVVDERGR